MVCASTFALPLNHTSRMTSRTKILVVHSDLGTLSRVYLALVQRSYKVEASDSETEIRERIKRMRPSVVILGHKEFQSLKQPLKIPAILLMDKDQDPGVEPSEELVFLENHTPVDTLVKTIEGLVI